MSTPTSTRTNPKKRKVELDGLHEYWKQKSEVLLSGAGGRPVDSTAMSANQEVADNMHDRLLRDGFFSSVAFVPESTALFLYQRIEQLEADGWPATFVFMYDEAWQVYHDVHRNLHAAAAGGNWREPTYDVLAFSIAAGGAGFSPHRDRQPADVSRSFSADGTPKYVTTWVALSAEVSSDNCCLFCLPAGADPGYRAGDVDEMDPLHRALQKKEAFQKLRCWSGARGTAWTFSHRLIHWSSDNGLASRVSISFVSSVRDFEVPYLLVQFPPSLPVRQALCAGQMICYWDRFRWAPERLALFFNMFEAKEDAFSDCYKCKVGTEFLAAVEAAGVIDGEDTEEWEDMNLRATLLTVQ